MDKTMSTIQLAIQLLAQITQFLQVVHDLHTSSTAPSALIPVPQGAPVTN